MTEPIQHSPECRARAAKGIGGCWCHLPAVQANIRAPKPADEPIQHDPACPFDHSDEADTEADTARREQLP
jgi:hypothetical protein